MTANEARTNQITSYRMRLPVVLIILGILGGRWRSDRRTYTYIPIYTLLHQYHNKHWDQRMDEFFHPLKPKGPFWLTATTFEYLQVTHPFILPRTQSVPTNWAETPVRQSVVPGFVEAQTKPGTECGSQWAWNDDDNALMTSTGLHDGCSKAPANQNPPFPKLSKRFSARLPDLRYLQFSFFSSANQASHLIVQPFTRYLFSDHISFVFAIVKLLTKLGWPHTCGCSRRICSTQFSVEASRIHKRATAIHALKTVCCFCG